MVSTNNGYYEIETHSSIDSSIKLDSTQHDTIKNDKIDKTKDEIFKKNGFFVYSELISPDDVEHWVVIIYEESQVYRRIYLGEAVCTACIVIGSILAGVAGCFSNDVPLIAADESELISTLISGEDKEKLDGQGTKNKFGASLQNLFEDGNDGGNDKSRLKPVSTNEYDTKDSDHDSDDGDNIGGGGTTNLSSLFACSVTKFTIFDAVSPLLCAPDCVHLLASIDTKDNGFDTYTRICLWFF